MATGPYAKPRTIQFKGAETFAGEIVHSYGYKTGRDLIAKDIAKKEVFYKAPGRANLPFAQVDLRCIIPSN
ncbi:MAG TPA: hypothetical protein VKH37_13150 [Ferruginibacter sp.]|nr:hypothetical protein [Ferruginibacter sp.]